MIIKNITKLKLSRYLGISPAKYNKFVQDKTITDKPIWRLNDKDIDKIKDQVLNIKEVRIRCIAEQKEKLLNKVPNKATKEDYDTTKSNLRGRSYVAMLERNAKENGADQVIYGPPCSMPESSKRKYN